MTIQIELIQTEHLSEVTQILAHGFGNKYYLGCIPSIESETVVRRRYEQKMPPAKWKLGAVAVDTASKEILGFIQMTREGLPMYPEGLHSCADDEMYIEQIAVSENARGKGIGTMLLQWSVQTATQHQSEGIQRLTLVVVNGNPAQRLYARFGFRVGAKQEQLNNNCIQSSFMACAVACFVGRPYGCCNEWGVTEMEYHLNQEPEGFRMSTDDRR